MINGHSNAFVEASVPQTGSTQRNFRNVQATSGTTASLFDYNRQVFTLRGILD